MPDLMSHGHAARRLECGIVLHVHEDACEVLSAQGRRHVQYAPMFSSPRTERVSPGHLVAMATAADGLDTVLWRWYDAVILGEEGDSVRLWEPAHGEVLARPRPAYLPGFHGTRAYLSAGLPGAAWWVAGPATVAPQDADVELDAVEMLYTDHGLWDDIP